MLTYRAGHVDQDLAAASERMTGDFRNEFITLINDVVIPGAKEKRISALATVPAAASVSASANRAEVLVYINQSTTVGDDPPTATVSSAQVLVQRVGSQWLVAGFNPV
jgi:Mce-associated membrane protein